MRASATASPTSRIRPRRPAASAPGPAARRAVETPAISMASEAAKTMPASSGAVSFIACVADDVTRETVSRAVAHLGWSDAKVRAGGIETAARSIDANAPPSLMLIDVTEANDPVAELAELAEALGPSTTLLAIGAVN